VGNQGDYGLHYFRKRSSPSAFANWLISAVSASPSAFSFDWNSGFWGLRISSLGIQEGSFPFRVPLGDLDALKRLINVPCEVTFVTLNDLHIFQCARCTGMLMELRQKKKQHEAS
jgi:hypothetical protein